MNDKQLDLVLEYLNTGNTDGIEIVKEGKIFNKIKGLTHDIIKKRSSKPKKMLHFSSVQRKFLKNQLVRKKK